MLFFYNTLLFFDNLNTLLRKEINMSLREDAEQIIETAIFESMPDKAVAKALESANFAGKVILVAVGKAAWQMANSACAILDKKIQDGIVITKYDHAKGSLGNIQIFEAGHPVPDSNSFAATESAIKLVSNLSADDTVLFLISGGGSALFEKPLCTADDMKSVTAQLLACGADIVEINTIRKRLSAVKGGRFAQLCAPAKVFSIVLSDIIGDPLDMIASGPAYPDSSTCDEALDIVKKYNLSFPQNIISLLKKETPKFLYNVETYITGSVRELCISAKRACKKLGYKPIILTDSLSCVAREAGSFFASIAQYHQDTKTSLAFIAGGETVVQLTGSGLGGRNQELALSAAPAISGFSDTALFSVGSDGTDGPTDAAGGYVDGQTFQTLKDKGVDISEILADNNAYYALQKSGGLIITGATGTNVNDLTVLLIKR